MNQTIVGIKNAKIDSILDSLQGILPVFHKKLMRMDLSGATGNLRWPQFAIIKKLSAGSTTVSELAKITVMSKPQMTHLIEQLVRMGMVERHPDAEDRRVINLVLTEHGRKLLKDAQQKVRENIKNRLSGLTPDELAAMSSSLEMLKGILARL